MKQERKLNLYELLSLELADTTDTIGKAMGKIAAEKITLMPEHITTEMEIRIISAQKEYAIIEGLSIKGRYGLMAYTSGIVYWQDNSEDD